MSPPKISSMLARHSHHDGAAPTGLRRYFSLGRSSVMALDFRNDDDDGGRQAGEPRWAVTMSDETPLWVEAADGSGGGGGHYYGYGYNGPGSLDSALSEGPRKLRQRRRASTPQAVLAGENRLEAKTRTKRNTMDAAVGVRPGHPPSFERTPEMQTIHEHSVGEFDGQRRPSIPPTAYPAYPGLQSTDSGGHPGASFPATLNRPRKLSGSTTGTGSSVYTTESMVSDARSPSWGSRATSFDSLEAKGWRPGYRLAPSASQRTPAEPDELFTALPGEVLELILAKLKQLHVDKGSDSCATCWMRDACNVSLSSRKWLIYARRALYEDVLLVGPDSAAHKKRFKLAQGGRMMLLRRTLRACPEAAALVRCLKVPRPEMPAGGSGSKGAMSMDQYEDLVATLVMACPNLERLAGPTMRYDHSFKKLAHALSTRARLHDMHWLVDQSPSQAQAPRRNQPSPPQQQGGLVMPGELQPIQEAAFLDFHRNWSSLSSLSVHCLPGGTLTPDTLLTRALGCLPSLKHLHLCNLPPNAFNDKNLLSLPRLETLALSHISGITSGGLSSLATRASSAALRRLHLRHTPLTSLPALARILSNLTALDGFSLVQAFPPLMPEADSFTLWMMPYLASSSVARLHWDITSHSSVVNAADDILARSVAAGGFPRLRSLRAPNDPEGVFQQLCRPLERVDLPGDRFSDRGPAGQQQPQQQAPPPKSPISPGGFLRKSPSWTTTTPPPPSPSTQSPRPPRCTDLCTARLAAQARLEAARGSPRFRIEVVNEGGALAETHEVGGFMGTVGSDIDYYLLPDAGSSDGRGGLVDVRDLGDEAGESLAGGREGCTGAWNRREGVVADKKEKERWWHTERGRWTRVEL